ncbi:MAG: hypothetical protein Q4F35_01605 [Akkermansia sp.]|nr:hypothetical protein [Akkermansia sp.]
MRTSPLVAGIGLTALTSIVQAAIPQNIDQAFERFTALPNTLVPILEKAKDRQSADAAAKELNDALPLIYDARTEFMNIQSLSPEVSAEVLMKYEKNMRRNWGKVYENIFRLQKARCYDSIAFFKEFQTLCAMLEQ